MLTSKIVHLKKIYKFDSDHFLVKCTVLVLAIKKGFYKIKKFIFRPKYARYENIVENLKKNCGFQSNNARLEKNVKK